MCDVFDLRENRFRDLTRGVDFFFSSLWDGLVDLTSSMW